MRQTLLPTKFCIIVTLLLVLQIGKALCYTTVLFSPDTQPATRLIELIDKTEHKIYAAVYMLTEKKIAHALVKAKKRGVDVQIVIDKTSMENSFGKGNFLRAHDIDVFVYKPKQLKSNHGTYSSLMHHKFALLDNVLWTGSFNWTKTANLNNQENVIITDREDNPEIYQQFEQQFSVLKDRCKKYASNTQQERYDVQQPSWTEYFLFIKTKVIEFFSDLITFFI